MSNINGASGSHYISNAEFIAWMQTKSESLYTKMADAMDVSNDRASAEDALNTIKAKIANMQAGTADANDVYALIDTVNKTYGNEFPDLEKALSPIAAEFKDAGAKFPDGRDSGPTPNIPAPPPETIKQYGVMDIPNPAYQEWAVVWAVEAANHPEMVMKPTPAKVTFNDETAKRWQDVIKDQVDGLSKQDQLGLINLQEYNAQLNQAKQTASALMDASDKAANNIISHIS